MTIRQVTAADAHDLAAVHVRTWQDAYRGIVNADFLNRIDVQQRADRWLEILAEPGETVTLAEFDEFGSLRGFGSIGPSRDYENAGTRWEVYSLYVDPSQQGHGVGGRLMHALIAVTPPITEVVHLWVLTANAAGRRFYESQGFIADGRAKDAEIGEEVIAELGYERVLRGA